MPTILITGAGSGIGRGLAEAAAQSGWRVLATDRDGDAARATAQLVGGEALTLDVTDRSSVAQVEGLAVDALVNNAGVQRVAPLEAFPDDEWERLIDILLTGACRMTRAVLPGMRARGHGRIVHIGSIHSLVASPYKSAYVAAKHGLLGFSKTIALETADVDITVNTICPSYVRTPLVEKQLADLAQRHGLTEEEVIRDIMLQPMPKRAFIAIDELWGALAFLLSPAARNVTGQTLVIDGGWTAR